MSALDINIRLVDCAFVVLVHCGHISSIFFFGPKPFQHVARRVTPALPILVLLSRFS